MACSSCNKPATTSKESFVLSKLGKCVHCIIASLLGTILCWILFFIIFTYKPLLPLQIMAVIFVTSFTSLLLAHSLRFLYLKIRSE